MVRVVIVRLGAVMKLGAWSVARLRLLQPVLVVSSRVAVVDAAGRRPVVAVQRRGVLRTRRSAARGKWRPDGANVWVAIAAGPGRQRYSITQQDLL